MARASVAERFPLDVGHHIVEEAVGLPGIEQRQDVRMLQGGGGGDLLHEAIRAQHRREVRLEDLDGHLAVVLQVLGEVHRGHAPLAELPLDAVPVRQRRGEA